MAALLKVLPASGQGAWRLEKGTSSPRSLIQQIFIGAYYVPGTVPHVGVNHSVPALMELMFLVGDAHEQQAHRSGKSTGFH